MQPLKIILFELYINMLIRKQKIYERIKNPILMKEPSETNDDQVMSQKQSK